MTGVSSPSRLGQLVLLGLQLILLVAAERIFAYDDELRIDRAQYESTQLELVGSSEADRNAFPYYVLFANGECGGTLISPQLVLTAANCVQSGHPATVRIGATNRTNGREFKVRCAKSHPLYSWPNFQYDIAVLKLEKPFQDYDEFPILNLAQDYPSVEGQELTVYGMGRDKTAGVAADTLMQLTYGFVTDNECKLLYQDAVSLGLHVCASGFDEGTCFGDAGGPLLDNIEPRSVVGVVTGASRGCADNKLADVYADVAALSDWILSQIDDDSCDPECVGCLCGAYDRVSRFGYRVSRSFTNLFN